MNTLTKKLSSICSLLLLSTFVFYQGCSDDDDDVPPEAAFSYTSDNDFHAPSNVVFKNESRDAQEYSWDFGDGSALSTEPNPTHTFAASGVYRVTLTARNGGLTDTETADITITAAAPVAAFTFTSDNEFHTPSVITFTNASVNAETYSWDFGDNSEPSTTENPVHTYMASGTYTVTLTASGGGQTSEKTATITITPYTPQADFTFISNNNFLAPSTITFTNTSTHAKSFSWDFGDDSSPSDKENPVHEYSEAGVYTVSLTVSNEGLTHTTTKTIEIFAKAYTGKYTLFSAVLTENVTIGADTYPAGTDVTDVARGLFGVVACASLEGTGMDLRSDGKFYFYCLESAAETQAGTWASNGTEQTISLSFTSPPYPSAFALQLTNIFEKDGMLTADLENQNIPGALIGFPNVASIEVSLTVKFSKQNETVE